MCAWGGGNYSGGRGGGAGRGEDCNGGTSMNCAASVITPVTTTIINIVM